MYRCRRERLLIDVVTGWHWLHQGQVAIEQQQTVRRSPTSCKCSLRDLITLSALASTFGGIVRPICFAV
jgi:hypothetical protein